jgi:hypothetical protein
MQRLIDTALFLISKLREIYAFFFNKKNEKIVEEDKNKIKEEQKVIHDEVVNKKIKNINEDLGWK